MNDRSLSWKPMTLACLGCVFAKLVYFLPGFDVVKKVG